MTYGCEPVMLASWSFDPLIRRQILKFYPEMKILGQKLKTVN